VSQITFHQNLWLTGCTTSVNDLFFDYERGQKLGLWVLAIDAGLLLGPTCKYASTLRIGFWAELLST
jgi:hypothetical protein